MVRAEPQGFAKPPPCPVADDGAAHFLGDGKAGANGVSRFVAGASFSAGGAFFRRVGLQGKRLAVPASAFCHAQKIGAALEPADRFTCLGPQALACRIGVPHRATLSFKCSAGQFEIGLAADAAISAQAERRLRPRARRAAIIRRPPTVSMRARKPWRRLRTIFEG
jgi:hypothetical protein